MNVRTTLWIGIMAAGLPMIVEAAGVPLIVEQAAYRWRNDDGSEAAATWKAAANTPITAVKRDENLRVRFAMWNVNSVGSPHTTLVARVEYAVSTNGPWMPVGLDPGRAFQMATTTGYTNGQRTTVQLTLSGSTFTPGQCVEDPENIGTAPDLKSSKATYSNIEACFRATAYAQRNTTYYFRINPQVEDGQKPDTLVSVRYAVLTIEDSAPPPPADIYVDDDDGNTLQIGEPMTIVVVYLSNGTYQRRLENMDYAWKMACANTVGAWNGGSRYNPLIASDTNNIAFRWIPNVPVAASYNVYARWTYGTERGRHVPYTIRHASGTSAEIIVNQRDPVLGGQWNLLGTYAFNVGTNGWVEMSGNNGQACADAVWLHRVN